MANGRCSEEDKSVLYIRVGDEGHRRIHAQIPYTDTQDGTLDAATKNGNYI